MSKRNYLHNKGEQYGDWELIRFIDRGGNGEIWEVENSQHDKGAIKLLRNIKPKSYKRFTDEISIVRSNSDIKGLLPILDFYLPNSLGDKLPWFVMPLAVPLKKHLHDKSIVEIIKTFISLASTLEILHSRKISHRDIKPGNLFLLNDTPCFGDFGLVEYPEKHDLTKIGESLGPKWTMAPEMRRNAETADGTLADVYSFIKTLWILITKQSKGFDGQYLKNSINSISNFPLDIYTDPLEELFFNCTDNFPNNRPTISEVKDQLTNWISSNESYRIRNKLQWKDIQKNFFPTKLPSRAIWEDIEAIVDILKKLSRTNDLCHVFLPTGGGYDLIDCRLSHEKDCIELEFGTTYICKPKRLVFESFGFDEEWNYFRLECNRLEPTSYYSECSETEYLTELEPLVYTHANCSEYNDFDGEKLPNDARMIQRILPESSFVLFRKSSAYNKIPATYDARHNKMTTDEFRNYIGAGAKSLFEIKDNSAETKTIKLVRPKKYRTKSRKLTKEEIILIEKTISLIEIKDKERSSINEKFEMEDGLSTRSKNYFEYMIAPRIKKKELEEFLSSIPNEQLVLLAAVMYGGRDSSKPWGTPLNELISNLKDHHDLVESISEKMGASMYFRNGIELYS